MKYFRELPNLQVINTTKNLVSNDETLIIKNFFKRAKIREDLLSVYGSFDYYQIQENERPDSLAQRVYGDSELDWVILLTNNIINVQDQWPISKDSFDNYLTEKYEETAKKNNISLEQYLQSVHHYETLELTDNFNRVVLPAKLIVDETFYNAPLYKNISIVPPPPGIVFPSIYIPGTLASGSASIGAGGSLTGIYNLQGGLGYKSTPKVYISDPPITSNASAGCSITNFNVTQIVGLSSGQGYNSAPNVIVSPPRQSIQSTASCGLGSGINFQSVDTIVNLVGGIGYGLTAPTITFDDPLYIVNGTFLNESSIGIGSVLDGMHIPNNGNYLYTTSGIGTSLVRQYSFALAWNPNTLQYVQNLNPVTVDLDFSYCTGIELSPDGTKLYVCGGKSGIYKITQYSLSTAWNLSTATKIQSKIVNSPGGIRFKSDGTKFYFLTAINPVIETYTVSVPWDISTASASPIETLDIQIISNDNGISGFSFFDSGKKLLVVGTDKDSIYEFNLSTPWIISTSTLVNSFFVGDRCQNPTDVFIQSDKSSFLVCGENSNFKLNQYRINAIAKATTTLVNGSVSVINITNSGLGYTVIPNITISPPYPNVTAQIQSNLSNGHVNLTITNPGFGYTVSPTISIDSAPISRKALAITSIGSTTGVSTVRIIDGGQNYLSPPTISFDSPQEILNVKPNDFYFQNGLTWKWTGSEWKQKITDGFQYFDPNTNNIVGVAGSAISIPITYYEYEIDLNEQKGTIVLLKPEYLPVVISDLKQIMQYDPLSEYYINSKLKGTYNPKLTGV